MKRAWPSRRGVSEEGARSDQSRTGRGAHSSEVDRMTVVDVLGHVDELAEGLGGSEDAVTGAAVGPYHKSRLRRGC